MHHKKLLLQLINQLEFIEAETEDVLEKAEEDLCFIV